MGEERLEALRVLASRRAPGAELGPHGQRHLGCTAGHERQLGGLVQQLVEADAEEVEVHQLDDGTHPGHGRADAEPDDRGLGDRGVAHAVAELGRADLASARRRCRPRRRRCPATNTRSSLASSASSAARIASMVRNTGASGAGGGGSARAGLARRTKWVTSAAIGARRTAGPLRRHRRARRPPTTRAP